MVALWRRGTTVLVAVVASSAAAAAVAPVASGATATKIVVTTKLDNTTRDGFCSLREAVAAANTHHAVDACAAGVGAVTIQLPVGTITLNSRLSVSTSLVFAGAGQSLSVIDGASTTGLLRVASSLKVTLQSLTLAHSLTVAVDNHGALTLNRVRLTGNQASGTTGETHMAAALENYGTATLTGTTVDGNTAPHTGGIAAIYGASGSTTTLTDDDFLSNTAAKPAPIVQTKGTLNATAVQFASNTSEHGLNYQSLGAILRADGALHATQLLFSANTGSTALQTAGSATANLVSITGNRSGGVFNTGTLTLSSASIVGNNSYYQYAGGVDNHGTLTLSQSTISGNSSTNVTNDGAGGIFNSGNATIANTTIDGNFGTINPEEVNSPTVGGFYNVGTATLNNVTLTANGASQNSDVNFAYPDTGGIENDFGTVTIGNSIIAYNEGDIPGANGQTNCGGTFTSTGYNLLQATETGCSFSGTITGNQTGDPELGPLQYNNGFAFTRLPLTGSPVIDAGNPNPSSNTPGTCEAYDERGMPRPQGIRCDMGAVERS